MSRPNLPPEPCVCRFTGTSEEIAKADGPEGRVPQHDGLPRARPLPAPEG
jgi:hypothetical protein